MEDKLEVVKFRQMPKKWRKLVIGHMLYYEGIDNQSMQDYMLHPIGYILNFCLEENAFNRFYPQSYSSEQKKEAHAEIIKIAMS